MIQKTLLLPSRLQFQSIRTLLLQSAFESVRIHRHSDADSGIFQINMDRPEAKNALGRDLLRGLQSSFEAISAESAANVLMICSSVSRVFCAGADLKERRTMSSSEARDFVNSLRSTFSSLGVFIEGATLGGGLEMALACDLRICGEDAKLALPETGLAVIPGGWGTRLPRLIGKSIAKELIYTGRKISPGDALSIGLINYCVPAGEAYSKALEVAREINEKPATSLSTTLPNIVLMKLPVSPVEF
ncbi:hypothetical protein OSB04_030117 [Centaurea solstitialis]|uniref:Enoyl-CoA hydratase n=1 Tax=Centaurea solstitialis TaxID=347529 RepID=A0AA38S859_9ASTR|nr:hypothetical protein OSB04_030117 [Centaurea solstitialis]